MCLLTSSLNARPRRPSSQVLNTYPPSRDITNTERRISAIEPGVSMCHRMTDIGLYLGPRSLGPFGGGRGSFSGLDTYSPFSASWDTSGFVHDQVTAAFYKGLVNGAQLATYGGHGSGSGGYRSGRGGVGMPMLDPRMMIGGGMMMNPRMVMMGCPMVGGGMVTGSMMGGGLVGDFCGPGGIGSRHGCGWW
ncbi:hypothetical protein BAUCODRAFT_475080 [Baudoinia panamericana UAMH 10762]|uniref:Uncharacterized protein n=1 Tax=Baudoinia panamericana (strain UAMH 10762) TaxID=717646 RepID=M2MIE9_BAUPA|nr:uncharacterized protein BAUCODRAFT_475080 [Baudoinia panamericana UAMH 10762]EMC96446.1 hypothetical protein BAUCODRAFT_475080 [Baudoinia panamericana UAMH 10762]